MSQKEQILAHLRDGHSLTPLDALMRFGCNRLAARICELRKDHDIRDRDHKTQGGAVVAEYYIPTPKQTELAI